MCIVQLLHVILHLYNQCDSMSVGFWARLVVMPCTTLNTNNPSVETKHGFGLGPAGPLPHRWKELESDNSLV